MHWIRKAVILGLSFYISFMLVKPIGVSTQFSVLSGILHTALQESVIWEDTDSDYGYASSNAYYNQNGGKLAKAIKNPWNYDFVFVLFIPIGAAIGARLYRDHNDDEEENDEKQTVISQDGKQNRDEDRRPSGNPLRSYWAAALAGFLILYGARMADGCTSGHMMSGMMQGAVSGYLFAVSVFASAIPTAIYTGKPRFRKGGEH